MTKIFGFSTKKIIIKICQVSCGLSLQVFDCSLRSFFLEKAVLSRARVAEHRGKDLARTELPCSCLIFLN